MATLLSVNVGMPKDMSWRGRTVHTGVWKSPVSGRRMVRRLNIDCLLYTSPSPRDGLLSRMPSSA